MTQTSLLTGQHSSASAEWWTPPEIVDPVRALWPIDLDPASCQEANRVIGAARFFTVKDDGLAMTWDAETVWCNPPSKRGENSAWAWWVYAAGQWAIGIATRILFQVFNPSSFFQIAQEKARAACVPTPQQCARVEFRDRVEYLRASPTLALPGVDLVGVRGDAPPHGSALLLLTDSAEEIRAFADAYAHLGDALFPARPAQRAGGAG